MRRFVGTVLILFLLYFGIQIVFKWQGKGFENTYVITNDGGDFTINEIYTSNIKDEKDNYYITIEHNGIKYSYQSYKNLIKNEKIIIDVKKYGTCILPVFKGDNYYFDITCNNNGIQKYYHDLKNTDAGLDNFATSLAQYGYDYAKWNDQGSETKFNKDFYYPENIVKGHYFGIRTYKGLVTINYRNPNEIYSTKIFEKDIYEAPISGFIKDYYITADYENSYEFKKFTLVNLKNNKTYTIEDDKNISFDSYFQGSVDNSIYLFDRYSLKQYEIDIKKKTITEVGNIDTKILNYVDGQWVRISAYDAKNSNIYFGTEVSKTYDSGYARIDKIGNVLSGFNYYYEKVGNKYNVYRSNIQDDIKTFLFQTSSIDGIQYVDDYVYFKDGDTIKYYTDTIGVRKLYKNSELTFNQNLKYNIYK